MEYIHDVSEVVNIYEAEAELFKALSHPIRLQILEMLGQEEACVCHLTAVLEQRQPYVSQQLMILRNAGLVVDRREGVMVYYRLANPQVQEIIRHARRLLQASGAEIPEPIVPPSPYPGCNCPKCARERI